MHFTIGERLPKGRVGIIDHANTALAVNGQGRGLTVPRIPPYY
ncbi:hypothetical protein BZL30_6395 [Mycobacterium kansasii]|uniref:Uncharacterized protein n=1 Tax=Mycobacterium kansasii TaxID=1768 RepID=A0A1V3WTC2_MYCKA|nr:hypothetical protein BZL30_6395 [Mycobacterium kansasii]